MEVAPLILLLIGNITQNGIENNVIPAGKNFTLVCDMPGLKWTHPIKFPKRIKQTGTENNSSFTVLNSKIGDGGFYSCYNPENSTIKASKLVYVFDKNKLLIRKGPIRELGENKYLVPCLKTHPEVNVTLISFPNAVYSPENGFTFTSHLPYGIPPEKVTCKAWYLNWKYNLTIDGPISIFTHEGENVTLHCSINTNPILIHQTKWTLPNSKTEWTSERFSEDVYNQKTGVGQSMPITYKDLIISPVKKEDEGEYNCSSHRYKLIVLRNDEDPYLNVSFRKAEIEVYKTDGYANFFATYEASLVPKFTWFNPNGNVIIPNKKYNISTTDKRSELIINQLSASDAGKYHLIAEINQKKKNLSITLKVRFPPVVKMKQILHTLQLDEYYNLTCNVSAYPKAKILWVFQKCPGIEVCGKNESIREMYADEVNATLTLPWKASAPGKMTCVANNTVGKSSAYIFFGVQDFSPPIKPQTIGAIAFVLTCLILAVIALVIKMVIDKRKIDKLTAREVAAFHEGTLSRINPDLEIDEQAHLLPYNKCFEFPREKLKLGKQLGNGAFGVVVKADAEGIKEDEAVTTVAVKMVKSNVEISHLRALMTELKILMYIGQNLNVLNLLGACTLNLMQRELLVIVEYCRFGNLHSFMHHHRDSFINQIDPITKRVDFNIGKNLINVSMNPAGDPPVSPSHRSAYLKSPGIQLPSSFTGETTLSLREDSMSSNCSSQFLNQWNVMYKCDAESIIADPINTKDLLSWSYQVAMGMDYLSKRKIVHADLASRNILLADNNVIKICDFGLARPLYGKMNYQKKSKDPLPIKWMAVESLEYRTFSSKSDVWSFGIVLWEIFSLGKSPYPGIEVDENFLDKLLNGYRMAKPVFSPDEIYSIMLECWDSKADNRPRFSELYGRIGAMLDSDTKQNYQELSIQYDIKAEASKAYYENWINERDDVSEYVPITSQEREYMNVIGEDTKLRGLHNNRDYMNVSSTESSEYLPMTRISEN